MSGGKLGPETAWWTLPNGISVLRLVLIIPVVTLVLVGTQPFMAAVLATIFGATDWADGFLARRMGQVTHTGGILDALADRFGTLSISLALAIVDAVPWWIIFVLALVDIIVAVASIADTSRSSHLTVSWIGKIRTAVIMVGAAAVMFGLLPAVGWLLPIGQIGLGLGAMLHAAAGIGYLRQLLDSSHHSRAGSHEAGMDVGQEPR